MKAKKFMIIFLKLNVFQELAYYPTPLVSMLPLGYNSFLEK